MPTVMVNPSGEAVLGGNFPLEVREDAGGCLLVVRSSDQNGEESKERFLAFPLDEKGEKKLLLVAEVGPGCQWFKTEREAGGGFDRGTGKKGGARIWTNIQELFIASAGPLKGHVLCFDEQKQLALRSRPEAPVVRETRYEGASRSGLPVPQKMVQGGEVITPNVTSVAESINRFAFDLYRQLGQKEGNFFYSPVSISTALAMTYAGAAGQTQTEMAHVLHLDQTSDRFPGNGVHDGYGKLTRVLNSGGFDGGYVLRTANRLWGTQSSGFLHDFVTTTREQYGAELMKLDFGKPEAARQEINTWIEQQTEQKIKDLIPPGVLGPNTPLVLTNAIYFKGRRQDEFREAATKQAPFFVTPEQTVEVSLMTQTHFFRHGALEDVQILELPYRGHEVSMIILLPKARNGLADLEGKLTAENEREWLASLRSQNVEVFLPKFKLTSQFALKDTLSAMGMPTPFTPAANFSKMTSGGSLHIKDVFHKAFVDVTERGTEAAAATAGVMLQSQPVVFRADHPFVFLLRDNRSGAILFLGRVHNPA
jgi:serpin B